MANLATFLIVALLVVFHRPLAALASGIFGLLAIGVALLLVFLVVRAMLFGI